MDSEDRSTYSELKTGKRPQQVNTRTLQEKESLFEEGSLGKELYIIQEGRVGVFKESPEGSIQLATIEKNGMVGEMSLLDNQPRSATIKALEKTTVIVINESVLKATLESSPVWLNSIVKIVVSRLRDTNKRIEISALRDRERGITSLMLLVLPECKYDFNGRIALSYDTVMVEAYYVSRLKKKEIEKVLNKLRKRGLVDIVEDTNHKKHIVIPDGEALRLFEEFLVLKSQKKKFRELEIPQEAAGVLSNIAYVAQKSGLESKDGTSLSKNLLVSDMGNKGNVQKLERILLDLRRRNLLSIVSALNGDSTIVFKQDVFRRIKKIKEWIGRFEMETE